MIECLSKNSLEMICVAIHCVNDWSASGRWTGVVVLDKQ
jgi:DMSO/TMAO reductase YedYZ molybdopterin-dependent catalytic subunit